MGDDSVKDQLELVEEVDFKCSDPDPDLDPGPSGTSGPEGDFVFDRVLCTRVLIFFQTFLPSPFSSPTIFFSDSVIGNQKK